MEESPKRLVKDEGSREMVGGSKSLGHWERKFSKTTTRIGGLE